jgi:hypothetical protein
MIVAARRSIDAVKNAGVYAVQFDTTVVGDSNALKACSIIDKVSDRAKRPIEFISGAAKHGPFGQTHAVSDFKARHLDPIDCWQ